MEYEIWWQITTQNNKICYENLKSPKSFEKSVFMTASQPYLFMIHNIR